MPPPLSVVCTAPLRSCEVELSLVQLALDPLRVKDSGWNDAASKLKNAGMTIGSHTRTHPVLPDYHAALHNEVVMSRAEIEEHLGRAPDFFAYPFGAWDAESAAWARTAGYRAARAYRGGAWNTPSDLFHLRAVPVTENMQAFERAVSGDRPRVVAQRGR